MLSSPGSAATPPTIPFDSTADLFVLDNGCDCLLLVAEDGTVTVAATEAEIAASDTGGASVSASEAGVAVSGAGTVYFVNDGTDSILSYDLDGTVSTVVNAAEIIADVGGTLDLEKIAFSPDGTLYVQEDSDERVLAVDVDTGAVTVLVEESDFTGEDGISRVNMNGGIAVDGSGTIYVASDASPDAVFSITPAGVVSVLATAANEVQAIETDATGGTFTLTFDGETTSPIAFDATAAEVQTAMEDLANIDPGDVEVSGTGTAADPWLIMFTGNYAGTDVPSISADGSGLSGGTVDDRTEITGGSFSDFDVHATLDADGAFVVADDSGATDIYRIDPNGDVSVVLLEREIEDVTGENADLEGGIAYDDQGRLYIAEENTSHILRFDGKVGEIWVENSTFAGASGDTPDFDGGIAFRMPIVDVSPSIDAPASAVPGGTLTYEVVVDNAGPNTLDGFEFSSGASLEDLAVTVDDGSFDGTLWTGDLASGDTLAFTVEGAIPSGATGTLDLTATTTTALGAVDTDTSNDTGTAAVDLTPSADLAIDKGAPASLAVGHDADVTLTVTNDGPSDATDIEVTDDLPAGLVLDGTAGDSWDCTDDDGSVTCTRADLVAGASSTLTLTVSTDVDCTADSDGEPVCAADGSDVTAFENTATVSSATADPDGGNNSDSTTTTLDTSEVEVTVAADDDVLPAAGATTSQMALYALLSILLGAVLLSRSAPPRRRSIA